MFSFIREIQSLTDLDQIGDRWISEIQELGVVRASYHMAPAFSSQIGPDARIFYFGFSEEIIELYNDPNFRRHDPIPDLIMQLGRPRSWLRALAQVQLDADQKRFVEVAGKLGIKDGFAIPLFGPNGRESYSSYDIGRRIKETDEALLQQLIGIGQIVHTRICSVVRDQFMRKIDLSPREAEVLKWAASSKSIADIATILDLSSATVDTYMRRLYAKLGAHNRIDAVTIAISRGLIRF